MRIGVSCMPSVGGSGVLATELGRMLARRGHEIHFITRSRPHRLRLSSEDNVFFHEVRALDYPVFESVPFTIALATRLAEVYRAHKLDLFHVHYAVPHAVAAYLAREMLAPCHAPIVATLHGTDITLVGQDPSYRDMVRFCLRKVDAVTAVSDWLKDETEKRFSPPSVERIHNFADPEVFLPRGAHDGLRPFAGPERTVFLHASNFRPVKRVHDAVRAFAWAVSQGVDGVLALAGEGPDLGAAIELATELGVGDRLHLLGVVEEIDRVLPLADVFLFPSDGESFGLAPLEAMLCEVPVVGAAAGGLPEVVSDGEHGMLLPVGDWKAMGEACVRLARDGSLRRSMGRAGRQRAIRDFSPDRIVSEYEALYERCREKRRCCDD
jgi:N-acetyl-alpha-D-glucosaminyl L-malate synthase BshA